MKQIQPRSNGERVGERSTKPTSTQIIEELSLATLSRFPSDKELALMRQAFDESGADHRGAVEDILWALLNTREFVYICERARGDPHQCLVLRTANIAAETASRAIKRCASVARVKRRPINI